MTRVWGGERLPAVAGCVVSDLVAAARSFRGQIRGPSSTASNFAHTRDSKALGVLFCMHFLVFPLPSPSGHRQAMSCMWHHKK
eukprot:172905-Chlamydomonas_euryale.AAC.8